MEKLYVAVLIPRDEGMLVRDPVTKIPILATGEPKPLTGKEGRYWRRRINDGSVKILEPKTIVRHKKSQKKEE